MNYIFDAPDKVMVGVRGEVGNRLFLLQARQGRRLVILKCEKMQLAALAEWLGQVLNDFARGPGHLPDDFTLEPEYEVDFAVGDISIAVDEDEQYIEVTFESMDDEDDLELTLSKEWSGGLAIAIRLLVEAGRPPCPLCEGPLDPKGHDCPRTNGHRPPIK